ncbi:MAG: hypothetical protein MUO26_15660, partial [Methanotrichaceae archaeon]|nr:hypothetical protein [Methanotrichaceae archaeon]
RETTLQFIIIGMILFTVFLYGLYVSLEEYKEETVLSAIWVLLPIMSAFLLAFKINILSKYILFVLPVYLIIISRGLINIKKSQPILFVVLLLIIFSSNIVQLNKTFNTQFEDWRSAALYLKANSSPDDIIIIVPAYTMDGLTYYGVDLDMVLGLDIWNSRKLNETMDVWTPRWYTEQNLVEEVENLSLKYPKTWIVYSQHSPITDSKQLLLNWLTKNCVKKHESSGGMVFSGNRIMIFSFNRTDTLGLNNNIE